MIFISFLRAIKFSFQDIFRNIWLSIVTITILVLSLFSVNILLTVNVISNAAINSIKEKIDINIYLKPEASEDQILVLRDKLTNLQNVQNVNYISKAAALESFRAKHQDNPEILDALREIGTNPLAPILIIKPKNIEQYESLISDLNSIDDDIIESRNFDDHKAMLQKINYISDKINRVGLIVSSIFIIISLLVVYNAIRVAIYTHSREIGVMRLVGASNWFIKAPFLFSAVIYAFLGTIAAAGLFYLFLGILQPYLEAFFVGYSVNIISYFNYNFVQIFGLQFLGAVAVNAIASLIAVRKYSKI